MTPGAARHMGFRDRFVAYVGMFMVLPVLTTYGMALPGRQRSDNRHYDRHLRAGAGYLSNSAFGLLSDRIGRKPLIVRQTGGIVAGSVIAAFLSSNLGRVWGERYRVRRYCRRRHGACLDLAENKTVPKR